MKSGNSGGRPDNWTVISDGAGMTKEELRKVPPVIGLNRPLQGRTSAKRPPPRTEEPPDAA